jgi:hypothetical protein
VGSSPATGKPQRRHSHDRAARNGRLPDISGVVFMPCSERRGSSRARVGDVPCEAHGIEVEGGPRVCGLLILGLGMPIVAAPRVTEGQSQEEPHDGSPIPRWLPSPVLGWAPVRSPN